MSIEIKINKDVGSYEAKFIGPFTKRQDICIALAAPACWWIYFGLAPVISKDVAGFLVFIPAVLAALFGWIKPYGMPMERFLRSVFISMFLAPAHRKYKTSLRLPTIKTERKKKYKFSKEAIR